MYVSVCMGFQKVRRLDDSLLPCRLLPAGLGRVGEEGPALRLRSSAWAAALAETLELLLARLAVATRLYFVAVSGAMLPTVSDHGKTKHRHG